MLPIKAISIFDSNIKEYEPPVNIIEANKPVKINTIRNLSLSKLNIFRSNVKENMRAQNPITMPIVDIILVNIDIAYSFSMSIFVEKDTNNPIITALWIIRKNLKIKSVINVSDGLESS